MYQTYNSSVNASNIYLYLGPSKKHRALVYLLSKYPEN